MSNFFNQLISGNTKLRYMECGFTEREAEAMAWICQQKAKGKFVGATTGLFLALTWGHWHDNIIKHLKINFSRRITQLGIVMGSILLFDYLYTGDRKGANELFANNLLMNTNLFRANVGSLIENFDIFTRKFTPEEIEALNYRKKLVRNNHHSIANKKWIYNDQVYTPEEFANKIKAATVAPWSENPIKPTNFSRLIDETGRKLGIADSFIYGWTPLQ